MDTATGITLASLITQGGVIASIFITQRHANKQREEAAKKVESALEAKTSETNGKLGEIHELVNSRLTVALEENKLLRKRLNKQDTTGKVARARRARG